MSDESIQERIARAIERLAQVCERGRCDPSEEGIRAAAVAAYREAAEVARETSPWIPVTERSPEPGQHVMTWRKGCDFSAWPARYLRGGFHDPVFGEGMGRVTHWMPLPPPPEENDNV